MRRYDYVGSAIFLVVIAVVLGLLGKFGFIDFGQGLQILITAVLVNVTAFYAIRTAEIAKATKEQAEASVRMAEERPYLLVRSGLEEGEALQWEDYEGRRRPSEFKVSVFNAGRGPAINIEACIWEPEEIHVSSTKGYLVPSEEWQATMSRLSAGIGKEEWFPAFREIVKQKCPGAVIVEYGDLYQHNWVSYLCFERTEIREFVIEGKQNIVEVKNHDS